MMEVGGQKRPPCWQKSMLMRQLIGVNLIPQLIKLIGADFERMNAIN